MRPAAGRRQPAGKTFFVHSGTVPRSRNAGKTGSWGTLWREESVHEAHRCRGDIHLVVGPILPRLALAPDDAGATRCSLRGSTCGHVMVKRRAGG